MQKSQQNLARGDGPARKCAETMWQNVQSIVIIMSVMCYIDSVQKTTEFQGVSHPKGIRSDSDLRRLVNHDLNLVDLPRRCRRCPLALRPHQPVREYLLWYTARACNYHERLATVPFVVNLRIMQAMLVSPSQKIWRRSETVESVA